ncbi:MAG: hypothetical protein KDB60_16740 [Propionibacteriaceae bacterium]|nr:hypothetical protein [Propionibacteriaceae bacterium]
MIRTRDDLAAYQAADAYMNGVDRWRPRHALTRGVVHFLHVMRLCEFWENQRGPLARLVTPFYKVRRRRTQPGRWLIDPPAGQMCAPGLHGCPNLCEDGPALADWQMADTAWGSRTGPANPGGLAVGGLLV